MAGAGGPGTQCARTGDGGGGGPGQSVQVGADDDAPRGVPWRASYEPGRIDRGGEPRPRPRRSPGGAGGSGAARWCGTHARGPTGWGKVPRCRSRGRTTRHSRPASSVRARWPAPGTATAPFCRTPVVPSSPCAPPPTSAHRGRLPRRQRVRALRRPAGGDRGAGAADPRGERDTVLLGATGTGKSATTAWLIEQLQRPTLVMAPNKTLAAQLANEFRELLPDNAVEYFVSYYDYYQPEAYVPQTDTYIEKDSSINEEVERLRHSATMSACSPGATWSWSRPSPASTAWAPRRSTSTAASGCKVGETVERDKLLRTARHRAVHPQRPVLHPRHVPGPRRHDRDLPGLRGARRPDRDVRRRDRAALLPAPADRRGDPRGRRGLRLPGHATTSPGRSGWSGRSAASRPSWTSGWPSWRGRASCWRRSGCACAPPTTSR